MNVADTEPKSKMQHAWLRLPGLVLLGWASIVCFHTSSPKLCGLDRPSGGLAASCMAFARCCCLSSMRKVATPSPCLQPSNLWSGHRCNRSDQAQKSWSLRETFDLTMFWK